MNQRSLRSPIIIQPFQWTLFVVVGQEEFQYIHENFIKDGEDVQFLIESFQGARGLHNIFSTPSGDLSLIYFDKDHVDSSTIMHECLHVVHAMFEDRGVPINKENTEALSYFLEQIVYEVKKVLVKREHLPEGSAYRPGETTF